MSNPVTHADVEDVLASIRRLVSEDRRPARPVSEAKDIEIDPTDPAHTRLAAADTDKLVLTPSLRVNSGDTSAEASDVSGFQEGHTPYVLQDDDEVYDASWGQGDQTDETTEAHMDPAEADDSDEATAEDAVQGVAADQPEDAPSTDARDEEVIDTVTELFKRDAADVQQEVEAANAEAEETAADAESPEAADADDNDTSNLLRRVTFRHERSVAPDAEADIEQVPDLSAEDEVMQTPEAQEDTVPEVADSPKEADKMWMENRAARQMALGAKIAALEAVVGRREDQWEPDGVDSDAYSGTAQATPMSWTSEDAAEPESDAEMPGDNVSSPEQSSEATIQPVEFRHAHDPAPLDDSDEADVDEAVEELSETTKDMMDQVAAAAVSDVLDHATLREIVSEALREELQGELGERITRNVRKLVRREIYRAMASREFE